MTSAAVDSAPLLHAILKHVPIGVAILDADGRHLAVSDEWCRQTGGKVDDVVGKTTSEYWGTPESRAAEALQKQVIAEGGRVAWQAYSQEEDGVRTHYRWCMEAMRDERGQVIGAVAFTLNVSEEEEERAARREAERQRDLFLAVLGHDLREPLSALALGAHALQRAPDRPEAVRELAGRIRSTTARMGRMVEQMLTFAQARVGELRPERQRTDLVEVCRQLLEELYLLHEGPPVVLHAGAAQVGQWDPVLLGQLVQNLVANALEHGAPPVRVSITGDADAATLDVRNANRGGPIPPEELRSIFEPYTTRTAGHLGLGLHIAKQIARAHGGHLEARSDASGTILSLRLPR